METTEEKLTERIKELTCLYEVTSIIVHSDFDMLDKTFKAIVECLRRAWQVQADVQVEFHHGDFQIKVNPQAGELVSIHEDLKIFNQVKGSFKVSYPAATYQESDFLFEEKLLLKNVSLALGNHLEKKEIQENEMAVKRQVEHADRLHILGEITAGIAHELNTPLANILGFAELLQNDISDPKHKRDLDKIVGNAIFSREVVKKLMFFACEMPQQMKSIKLQPIVEEVIALLGLSLQQKQLALNTQFSHETIEIKADPIQLTQVLFNLIMNAVYYSPSGGKINLEIKDEASQIIMRIKDEGKGMSPDISAKIMEPFFTTKPLGEGSGLGLSVVHGIMKSHKGELSYAANHPKGAIFTVTFPKLTT